MKEHSDRTTGNIVRGLLAGILTLAVIAAAALIGGPSRTYKKTAFIMDTVFNISLELKGDDPTGTLIEMGESLESEELSSRVEGSELSRINAAAGDPDGCALTPNMEEILTKCLELSKETDGAFDVTIGALIKLWDIDGWADGVRGADGESFVPPSDEEVQAALAVSGYEKVRIEDHRIYMPAGMSIDPGAVGKGIYLDRCRKLIPGNASGVISAGGSILTVGVKKGGEDYNIGITDPFDTSGLCGSIGVKEDMCVSTSGSYERFAEYDGKRYHHILDPRTGYPAESGLSSVTIVSESGFVSDALSTACFVMGEKDSERLAKEYGADILMIRDDGTRTGNLKLR